MSRRAVADARRIVVKLGTRVLVDDGGELHQQEIAALAATVAGLIRSGREVVLVSSGAVGHGRHALGLDEPPRHAHLRKACAAVGQSRIMDMYQRCFRPFGLCCGQLLVGQLDFDVRQRTLDLRRTLTTLIEGGIVPVLNENDALAVYSPTLSADGFDADPLGRHVFPDNDRLAALVASECAADLLLILTDVDGIFDRHPEDPEARLLSRIDRAEQLPECPVAAPGGTGRGGMRSKIEAALIAVRGGCQAVIAGGRRAGGFSRAVAGEDVGTWFPAGEELAEAIAPRRPLGARHRWIAFASVPRGTLHLDAGAVEALRRRGASLLPAGVVAIDGEFTAGEVVELRAPDRSLVGRALASAEAAELRGRCSPSEERTSALIRRANIVMAPAPTDDPDTRENGP